LYHTKNEWELIAESIDFVDAFSKKYNANMVCAYDEFGDIKKFDPNGDLVKLFRSKIHQQTNSTYIFSGSFESVMQNMFVSSKAPFYRLARIIHLEYMEEEPLAAYLKTRFKQLKIKLPVHYPVEIVINEKKFSTHEQNHTIISHPLSHHPGGNDLV